MTIEGFSVDAKIIQVQQEDVFLFDYPTEEKTEAELAKLSDDGRSMGNLLLPWPTEIPLHVFATGQQIAVYVGSTKEVIEALLSEGGPQVVGDPLPEEVKMPASSASSVEASSLAAE